MRFLFDECLTPELVGEAHERGYDASHVNYMGLLGFSDRSLLPQIVGGDFTFVTNNRRDFLRLFKHVDIHARLLIIVPSVQHLGQIALFVIALDAIEARAPDIVNELVEVDRDGRVRFSRYPFDGDNG
ncbi:MAG: DUF5615 family PIN-like protein [Sandarakinorhabdus sp.]|nr:DUF5615 family PIN-like protein [Sandarakinorhabdus sp.]